MTALAASYFCPRCGGHGPDGACSRDGTPRVEVVAGSLLGMTVGNYTLVRLLGEGGMGSVYRAVQPEIGAEVAIKVLHATPQSHANAVQRFMLEAQAVNRVRHAGLIRILDTGWLADNRPYLVMELLDGIPLNDGVGRMSPQLATYIAHEALEVLEAVHAEGIVHRDLKPANLYLTRDGRVVVLDFGIAKLVDAEGVAQTHSTGMIGTPEYMAPEQIRSQPLDRRTDVYAMGVLMYETITGVRPFAAAATFDMLVQHLERPPASPRERVPALSRAIEGAILRALEKDPARRFQSAREMAEALPIETGRDELEQFVAARAPAPTPVPIEPQRTPKIQAPATVAAKKRAQEAETVADKPTKRSKRPWFVGAGVVALAVGIASGYLPLRSHTPKPPPPPPAPLPVVIAPMPVDAAPVIVDPGTVGLSSEPTGAAITIDGSRHEVAPVMVDLAPGAHHLTFALPNHKNVDVDLDIVSKQKTMFEAKLPRVPQAVASHPATEPATRQDDDDSLEVPAGLKDDDRPRRRDRERSNAKKNPYRNLGPPY
ncbi:MAG: serine/threonine-protein kinase [Kofleriaceae bacterium]